MWTGCPFPNPLTSDASCQGQTKCRSFNEILALDRMCDCVWRKQSYLQRSLTTVCPATGSVYFHVNPSPETTKGFFWQQTCKPEHVWWLWESVIIVKYLMIFTVRKTNESILETFALMYDISSAFACFNSLALHVVWLQHMCVGSVGVTTATSPLLWQAVWSCLCVCVCAYVWYVLYITSPRG